MTNQIMKLASGKNVYKLKKRKSFQQMVISIYSFFLFYKEGFFLQCSYLTSAGCIPQKLQYSFKCNFIT